MAKDDIMYVFLEDSKMFINQFIYSASTQGHSKTVSLWRADPCPINLWTPSTSHRMEHLYPEKYLLNLLNEQMCKFTRFKSVSYFTPKWKNFQVVSSSQSQQKPFLGLSTVWSFLPVQQKRSIIRTVYIK